MDELPYGLRSMIEAVIDIGGCKEFCCKLPNSEEALLLLPNDPLDC